MALVQAVGDQEDFFDVGLKFKPTDVEILDHYVRRRLSGFPEPNLLIIKSEDVYAYKPWNLQKLHQFPLSREMYFFTLRRPASKKRVSRRVDEGGKWDCKVAEKAIYKQEVRDGKKVNVLVGYRNQLSFKDADKGKMHDQWIMHEYRVDESVSGFRSEIQDKLVFCKIYKKKELGEEEGDEERCAKRQRVCYNEAAVAVAASADGLPAFDPIKSLDDFELSAAALALPAAETSPSMSPFMDGTRDDHEFAASADDDSAFYAKLSEDFNASHREIAKLLEDNPSDAVALYPPSTQRLQFCRPL